MSDVRGPVGSGRQDRADTRLLVATATPRAQGRRVSSRHDADGRLPFGSARRHVAGLVDVAPCAKLSRVRKTGHTSACYSSALTRGGSMRIVRTAALGAAVVIAAGVAVATQTRHADRPAISADEVGLVHVGIGAGEADRARRAARRLRGADRDARRARVPHHHAQAGWLAPCAAHPPERRTDHRQGRRGRGLHQRRMEAGADRVPDLLRHDGAAHRPQHRDRAGDLPRRQLGGPRDEPKKADAK